MKKTIRIVALCLFVLTLLCIFGSCGKSEPNEKPSMEEINDVISEILEQTGFDQILTVM